MMKMAIHKYDNCWLIDIQNINPSELGVNVVTAYGEGDTPYATLIDHMNELIDRKKVIFKWRITLNKNHE